MQVAEEATWQAVVLITKGKNDYRGIGLVEVMWKVVAAVLNRWLTASITFHQFLHGFWAGRGTGTTIVRRLHYVWRSLLAQGPTLYPSRISRHLDLSKSSYTLCRSRKITYRTSSLKSASC